MSRLVLQKCADCGRYAQLPSVLVCGYCGSEDLHWSQVSGRATIYSFTVVRQATTRGFDDDVPYVVVSVELAEQSGLLMVTNLVGEYDLDRLEVGQPVIVVFERREGATVPQFRLDCDA